MFSEELKYQLDAMLETYNDNHSDAIDLICEHHLGVLGARDSRISSINEEGIHLSTSDGGSTLERTLEFLEMPNTNEEVVGVLLASLSDARSKAPSNVPKTKIELEFEKTRRLKTYFTEVFERRDVSSNILELKFKGGLEELPNLGNDAFLYFIVDSSGETDDFPPGFSMETFRRSGTKGLKRHYSGAYYTIRGYGEDAIDVWFVRHADAGPLSHWAENVSVGGKAAIWGPRTSFKPPQHTNRYLFIADETAQPAVLSSIENLPDQCEYACLFETHDDSSSFELGDKSDFVEWIYRKQEKAGEGTGLIKKISELKLDTDNLYIFGAGETRQMSAIRRQLMSSHNLSSDQITMVGYWSRSRL